MKVTKFWAKSYRSLRDVTLDDLGDYNIFYGPNGAGKSNVLDALQALFCIMPLAVDTAYGPEEDRLSFREAGERASAWVRAEDFDARQPSTIVLGAILEDAASRFGNILYRNRPVTKVEVEINFWKPREGQFNLRFTRLLVNTRKLVLPFSDPAIRDLLQVFVPKAFTHLGVTRTLSVKALQDSDVPVAPAVGTIPDREVVSELFRAKNASDRSLRQRFDKAREFLAKTLHRGLFDVFIDAATQRLELREMLPEPNPHNIDIRVDRAGHGVVQLYAIVATILLAEGRLVAIEEPEAHLHAPSMGRELRSLLYRMVSEGEIHQLFIATHSNLFDLDPTGYWDVSLDSATAETRIARKPLSEIDAHHLYEPGPAKHALAQLLRYAPENELVFRRPDNSPVTAGEMLRLLQEDDKVALDFLRSLHGAALRIVRLNARKEPTTA